MWGFLLGGAIGYALGCRAGRERHDRLGRIYREIADHPMVQGAAGVVSAKISQLYGGRQPSNRGR